MYDIEYVDFTVFPIYDKDFKSNKRFCLIKGGRGSGKSNYYTEKILYRTFVYRNTLSFVLRRYYSTLARSNAELFVSKISDYKLKSSFYIPKGFTNRPSYIRNRLTNSIIYFKGLDDAEKIKGLENAQFIWIDEAQEVEEMLFNSLDDSIRGEPKIDFPKQISLTFNPVPKSSYLYRLSKKQNATFTTSTVYDNEKIDQGYINNLEEKYKDLPEYYNTLVLGNWATNITGLEYYTSYKYATHSGKLELNSSLPLHISIDFNVSPYIALTIWQIDISINRIEKKDKIKCIKEYTLEAPYNNIESTIDFFKKDFEHLFVNGLYLYGDVQANNRTLFREYKFILDAVTKALGDKFNINNIRINKSNPKHIIRREVLNLIFLGKEYCEIIIDESCVKLHNDIENIKITANGTKLKEKGKHNGYTVEKYGHLSDTMDYFIMYIYNNWYKQI